MPRNRVAERRNLESRKARRNVIKTIGAGLVMSGGLNTAGSVTGESSDGVRISIRRSVDNPMTLEQANRLTIRAADQYRSQVEADDPVGYTQRHSSHDTDVYAMVLVIRQGETTRSYIGSTSSDTPVNRREVQKLHDRANKFEQSTDTNKSEVLVQANSSPFQATSDDGDEDGLNGDWNVLADNFRDILHGDYGLKQVRTRVGEKVVDGSFYSGLFTKHINSPGVNEKDDSRYRQYLSWQQHDHGYYEAGNNDLTDYEPDTNKSGSFTFTATIGFSGIAPTLEVQTEYSPVKVSRTDESTLSDEIASWKWDYNENPNWDGATKDPDIFEPISTARSETPPSSGDAVLGESISAEWYNPFTGTFSPKYTSTDLVFY